VLHTASSKSVSEEEGDDIPTASDDQKAAAERKEEVPLRIYLPLLIRGHL
jgi:hypothetical protein